MIKQCCICGKSFIGYGNNPAPVKSEGVCCDDCNRLVVIPKRFSLSTSDSPNKTKCKSCGAFIIWIKTIKGKSMPCNAGKVFYIENVNGKDIIVTPNGEVVRGDINENGTKEGYISHFATCSNANKHRRNNK